MEKISVDNRLNKIHCGNAREVLKTFPDGCFQMCVTSPPYWGLRDYGVEGQLGLEKTPEEYISKMVAVFSEVRRVLKKDGTLWLNIGDSYAASRSYQVSDNKHPSVGAQRNLANAKPPNGLEQKDLVGIPWMLAFALRADGWYLRQDIIWNKPNCMPESVRDRCTKSHEYLFLLSKSKKYYYDAEAIKEKASPDSHARYARGRSDHHKWADGGPGNQSIAKSFEHMQNRKPRGWHNSEGYKGQWPGKPLPGVTPKSAPAGSGIKANESFHAAVGDLVDFRNRRSVWDIPSHPFSEAHFATFPPDLVKPCILACSRPGDLVLDCFGGSGTTAFVAQNLGRNWVLIELSQKYITEIAEPRIKRETAQQNMFTSKIFLPEREAVFEATFPDSSAQGGTGEDTTSHTD